MVTIGFMVASLLITSIPYFFGREQPYFLYTANGFTILSSTFNETTFEQERLASLIVQPLIVIVQGYSGYVGYQFFSEMSEGETPFQAKYVQNIRSVSIVLMIAGVLIPLIYSLAVTLLKPNGYYLWITLTTDFFVGLFLYVTSEIINYGVSLQELTDDTI